MLLIAAVPALDAGKSPKSTPLPSVDIKTCDKLTAFPPIRHFVEFATPTTSLIFASISPKSKEFPVDAIVIYSITSLIGKIALVLFDAAPYAKFAVKVSPKSVPFPVLEIVIYSIVFTLALPLYPPTEVMPRR